MPRRVNNLFKIHKAKLVPSIRLGALVELHQRWIWLHCFLQQPLLYTQETACIDLACGNDENPPVRKTEHTTEQRGGGKPQPPKVRTIASFICFVVLDSGLFSISY